MIIKRTKQKSNRYLRVAEITRKAVSEVLLRNELPLSPSFQFPLSVVKVQMSSDLRIAYIFVTTHENLKKDDTISRLESCRKFISKEVNKLIDLKFSPKLIFKYHLALEKHDEISKLLKSNKVRIDLKKSDQ